MTLYVSSLLVACGICFFAGLQFTLAGAARIHERVYLAFGCLCLLLSGYLLLTAILFQTGSVSAARSVVRGQVAFACFIYPAGIWFFSLYTGLAHWRRWVVFAGVIFGGLLISNFLSPYSVLYVDIVPRAPLTLPWGETVSDYGGTGSRVAWIYYAAEDLSYVWVVWRCASLWRKGRRARAWPLALYLVIQIAAAVHAEVVDRSNEPAITYDAFAFLALVILMSDALRRELRRRTSALAASLAELRVETDRRQGVEADLRHMAYHDHLTGLPNRHFMHQRLHAVFASAAQERGALILFDLDHFKTINEALGHGIGDELLNGVAGRMAEAAPSNSCVARFGGDEFALFISPLVCGGEPPAEVARRIAGNITARLIAPFGIGELELVVGVSAGIALVPGIAKDVDSVFRQVDMALYRAKSSGRNTAIVFESPMQVDAERRLLLEKGLRLAIDRDEFELHYQPQLDMQGRFVGAEALLRWMHPAHGLIEPSEFIPIAEETGLIHAIGREVLRRACVELDAWPLSLAHARLSVNISPWQLFAQDFVRTIEETVESAHADPKRLTLEITENAFLHDLEDAATKIRKLDSAGFHFSLDDFGSGYASLASLKKLPVRELKIDRVFIEGLQTGSRDRFIEAMIAIAHHLELYVIAEGVETEVQRAALIEMGCDAMQGYLVSRPMPALTFRSWLAQHAA